MSTAAEIQTRERLAEPYRFTREDYDAMIAAGILDENDRVELIAGESSTERLLGLLMHRRLIV